MEKLKMENLEERTLINELSQGKELAMELMSHIQQPSSHERRDFLVGQILSSYDKALSMINHANVDHSKEPKTTSLDSPRSVIFDPEARTQSVAYKKRKTMPRWSKQVKVCSGTGVEGPIEDGYSWRKYGQKDILGSSHPRGYYRCTHRHSQGCLATKQVQKSDQDSSILEVTYKGGHTCNNNSSQPPIAIQEVEPLHLPQLEQKDQNPTQSTLLNLKSGLAVKTEEFESMESHIFPPFSFPSTPVEYDYDAVGEPFLLAANSPWHVGAFGQGNNCNVQTSESDDLSDILSAPTSVTNSPMGDYLEFPFDADFGLNFSFDSPEFFS